MERIFATSCFPDTFDLNTMEVNGNVLVMHAALKMTLIGLIQYIGKCTGSLSCQA